VLITLQTALAEDQSVNDISEKGITAQAQPTEDLSPSSPYNINNSEREVGSGFIRTAKG